MTQDERWQNQYDRVMDFMVQNHRRPSKHRVEEHAMLNWIKHCKKLIARDELPKERAERFARLMEVADSCRHINQYK